MANFLNIENLTKSYGDRLLFGDITFGVDEGDKIGIVAVIALAAVFYFAVLFAVGGVKKQDVLLMPKGEKIAKLLNLK